MNLEPAILEGFLTTLTLHKQGEDVTSILHTKSFPTLNSQAKWHFAKHDSAFQLLDPSSGDVHHFDLPEGFHDSSHFSLFKGNDKKTSEFGVGASSKGLAQVHRADPGSVYLTLQDGKVNPTLHIKHVGGVKWLAVPKARKAKAPATVPEPQTKEANSREPMLRNTTLGTPTVLARARNAGTGLVKAIVNNPLASTAAGLGLGAAYDLGRRALYNTAAENEQETALRRLARVAIPGAALAGLSFAGRNFLGGNAK